MNKELTDKSDYSVRMENDVCNCWSKQSSDIKNVSFDVVGSMKDDGASKNTGDKKNENVGIVMD